MTIEVSQVSLHILNVHTRMPFKYGIATMTAMPHCFVRVVCQIDERESIGVAADSLAPKWFTKDPNSKYEDDIADMLSVINKAGCWAKSAGPQKDVFTLWQHIYTQQKNWAKGEGHPPLLWNFGVSLIERALIDAFCRGSGVGFETAVRQNTLGIVLEQIHPELIGKTPSDLLNEKALRKIAARHTIGLADPLTDAEIPAEERLDDGLPQSFASVLLHYGVNYLKIKIQGDVEKDLKRLKSIAKIVAKTGIEDYQFTLDGNEQYHDLADFRKLWEAIAADKELKPFMAHLIFVEQPIHRSAALNDETAQAMQSWQDAPPTIIDESDADLTTLRRALGCGYVGTSHKNCKGVIKGLANACYLNYLKKQHPEKTFVLSGEDLSNIGPVALLQDLAVMATMGIDHVERNGHHYFRGLSMLPEDLQQQVLKNHHDLYRDTHGYPALDIQDGEITIESVVDAPFGYGFQFDPTQFVPHTSWNFESLH
ncbi:MAG: hypothetical protein DWQ04_24855 [Chloroflexi bacterium]|nr:MAG: hypothetical protein DWQ04_24855 [Chloroflexota bacterium]